MMKGILFFQLLSCVTNAAFALFALDLTLGELNFDTLITIMSTINVLSSTFIYCYFADGVTSDLLEIGDIFYNSLWYKLPLREQKLLFLPIQRAQKEFRLDGFGMVYCTLETFGAVCH